MRTLSSQAIGLSLAVALVSSCSLDLDLPQTPQQGGLKGVIDTSPSTSHVQPANLTVTIIHFETGQRFETHTDPAGAFEVAALPPGAYQIVADIPTFAPLRDGPYRVLAGEVTDAGTLTPAWLSMTPQQSLVKGLVVVNGGANAGADAGGRPSDALGAKVSFFLDGTVGQDPIAFGTVDAFGTFSVTLPPATYTVQVTHPYYSSSSRMGVIAPAGGTADLTSDPLVMGLNPAEVSGIVKVEVDKEPDATLTGVLVVSDTGLSVPTDSAGHYVLGGLAAGTRTLTFVRAGFHDLLQTRSVMLGGGEKLTLPTFTMALDRGDIVGDVEMSDGTPLQQVTVDVVGLPYSTSVAQGATPSTGHFQISGVPVGTYNVRASRPSYVAAQSAAVMVTTLLAANAGTLRLARIQGDFVIDDGDPTNTAGFTRTRNVTLVLSNVASAAQYRVAEGSSAALMGATYQPFSSTMIAYPLTAGDGLKNVFLQFKDAMNNESPPLSSNVVLDGTAPASPSILIAGGAPFTKIPNPLPVTLSANDTGSGVALVRLSASAAVDMNGALMAPAQSYQRDLSFTRPSSADGMQSVSVQFIDNAGNASAVATASVVIDTVAPTGIVTIARGPHATLNGYTDTVLVNLTETPGAAEPNGGYLLIRLANSSTGLANAVAQPVQTLAAWFLDPNGEGDKTVYYQYVDAAGNESAPGNAVIKLDTTAPAVTAMLTTPALTNSRNASLSLTATDSNPLSPTEGLTVSESPLFSGATPTAYPAGNTAAWMVSSGDGPKVIYVRVKDAAGNAGVASATLTLDQSPPTGLGITLIGALADGTPSTTLSAQPTVSVQLTASGATAALLGDATLMTCPSSGYTALPPGNLIVNHMPAGSMNPRKVRACFVDAAGNTAGPVEASINIDTVAPTGCALVMSGKRADGTAAAPALDKTALRDVTYTLSTCVEQPVEIYLTEGSITCSASVSVSWVPYNATSNPVTLSAVDAPKTVRGCVRDAARNTTSFVADSLTLDTTPPTGTSVTIDSGNAYVNLATKMMRGNVNLAPVAGAATGATEWAIAEAGAFGAFTAFPSTSPANFTFSTGDGVKTIRALFADDVGNVTPFESTDTLTFDTVPPSLTSVTVSGATADGTASDLITSTTSVQVTVAYSGATQMFVGDVTGTCPAAPYPAYAGGPLPFTLLGSGSTRGVRVCAADEAGNITGPSTDTIAFDAATPTGCALALTGYNASTPPVATSGPLVNFTAQRDVTVALTGCSETPTQIFLTEGTVTCSTASVLDWRTYVPGMALTVSGGDALKTVNGCVRDAALNTGSFVADGITLDSTPPTAPLTVLINNGATYVNAAAIMANGYVASVQGTATGATQWAIGQTPNPSSFVNIASNPQSFTFTPASDGVRRIYAVFRDDLDNRTSATLFDDITFDGAAPSGGAFSLSGNGYTNTPVVTVNLTPPGEPVSFQLVEATPPCSAASFSTAADRTFVPTTTFVLSGTEGTKTLCVRFADQAGNYGAPVAQQQVVLDTTPPTKPQIITSPAMVGPPVPGSFAVTTSGPSTDTNFARYEVIGGGFNTWTAQVPSGNTFTFTLTQNGSVEAGVPNVLRVRAVDQAGNVSAEDSVLVTVDTSPPTRATLNPVWVDNGNGEATLFWTPSTSGDVKGYLVYYAGTPQNGVVASYHGTGAIQGNSPFFVPASSARATLSGVANGSPLYVTVIAVDQVNQQSPPPTGTTEVTLEPNFVSLNRVASVTINSSPSSIIKRIVTQGHYAYVGSTQNASCFSAIGAARASFLTVVDLSSLKTPVQNGVPQTVSPPPIVFGPQLVNGAVCPTSSFELTPDLIVDGPWLYFLAGSALSVYSLNTPATPQLINTVNVSAFSGGTASTMGLIADKLFIGGSLIQGMGGTTQIVALDLGDLFDSNAATFPSAALQPGGDVIGSVPTQINTAVRGTFISRNRLGAFFNNTSSMDPFLLDNAIDNNIATPWNTATAHGKETSNFPILDFPPRASGNYLVTPSTSGLSIFTLNGLWAAKVDGGVPLSANDAIASVGVSAEGSPAIEGPEIFLADTFAGGVHSLNTEDYSAITDTGFNDGTPFTSVSVTTTYGNYLLTTATADLVVYETATPRSPHAVGGALGGGVLGGVASGLLYAGSQHVFDLQNAGVNPQPMITTTVPDCMYDATHFDDFIVATAGNNLIVTRVEDLTDRDPATSLNAADTVTLPVPAGTYVTSLQAYGNYLVLGEVRADGVWVEVLDARPIRNRSLAAGWVWATQSRGSLRLVNYTPTWTSNGAAWVTLTLMSGRAFVGVDDAAQPVGFYVADLRPLFDDVAGGSITALGSASVPRVLTIAVKGNTAYLGSNISVANFVTVDVTGPMSEPAVALSSPTITSYNFGGAIMSIDVSGSYAVFFVRGGGVYTADLSTGPKLLGYLPLAFQNTGCQIISGMFPTQRAKLQVAGTRAYVGGYDGLRVVELE